MRSFERTAQSLLDKLIALNTCDVFLSTWDVIGVGKHHRANTAQFLEPLDTDRAQRVYGPHLKGFKAHDFKTVQAELPKLFYPGMVSMFWQIKQANELKRHMEESSGFRYDVVIRSRPDLALITPLRFEDPSKLAGIICARSISESYMDDCFACGHSDLMDYYAALFDYLPHYQQVKFEELPGAEHGRSPERILKYHLLQRDIGLAELPIETELCRDGHSYE